MDQNLTSKATISITVFLLLLLIISVSTTWYVIPIRVNNVPSEIDIPIHIVNGSMLLDGWAMIFLNIAMGTSFINSAVQIFTSLNTILKWITIRHVNTINTILSMVTTALLIASCIIGSVLKSAIKKQGSELYLDSFFNAGNGNNYYFNDMSFGVGFYFIIGSALISFLSLFIPPLKLDSNYRPLSVNVEDDPFSSMDSTTPSTSIDIMEDSPRYQYPTTSYSQHQQQQVNPRIDIEKVKKLNQTQFEFLKQQQEKIDQLPKDFEGSPIQDRQVFTERLIHQTLKQLEQLQTIQTSLDDQLQQNILEQKKQQSQQLQIEQQQLEIEELKKLVYQIQSNQSNQSNQQTIESIELQ